MQAAGVDVVAVSGRKPPKKKLAATLVLLCVPDREVGKVAVDVDDDVLVCHVAGSLGLAALSFKRRGVFHPLASLDGKLPVPRGCLCAFDAADDDDALRLQRLAKRIHLSPCRVRDADRARYHAGAVIAGNLATALLQLGIEQLVQAGVDVDVARVSLARLLASTAARSVARPLDEALTGPVARRDAETLAAHLAAIQDPTTQQVYRLLSGVLIDRVLRDPKGDDRDEDDVVDTALISGRLRDALR
ncbi:MAG: DUF2520 domain-containing protein [Deltaproteobacteria bacterium]|nr:DUF2520 domain-containing protein [Deltaproteobacteria bacterium]